MKHSTDAKEKTLVNDGRQGFIKLRVFQQRAVLALATGAL